MFSIKNSMKLITPMITFTIFSLLASLTSSTTVVDFCVADLNLGKGPAGYPCKDLANVTVHDFVYSRLGVPGNTSATVFKFALTTAIDDTFPGLNGLGLGMFRIDLGVGGVAPLHTHRTSELIVVIEGTVVSGFVNSNNKAYYTTLKKGDIMILPPNLLHFQANIGEIPALMYAALNSANPGAQIATTSFSGNDLPTQLIERITLLDDPQVKKLKNTFGGTN